MALCRIAFLAFLALNTFGSPVSSATIEITEPNEITWKRRDAGECNIQLSGAIVAGDADKLERILDAHGGDHDDRNHVICLDSNGGSLTEAIKIGRILAERVVGTVVAADSDCLSACAIVFMHGTVQNFDTTEASRILHPTGRLGFHAPSLELGTSGTTVPVDVVTLAYSAAVAVIADLAETGNTVGTATEQEIPVLPLSLFTTMLRTPPSTFQYVNTVDELLAWGIQLPNGSYQLDNVDFSQAFYQICENAMYQITPEKVRLGETRDFSITPADFSPVNPVPEIPPGHTLVSLQNYWDDACSFAIVRNSDDLGSKLLDDARTPAGQLYSNDIFWVRRYIGGRFFDEKRLPPYFLFSPSVQLSDVYAQ
jgi:hypothetical protein